MSFLQIVFWFYLVPGAGLAACVAITSWVSPEQLDDPYVDYRRLFYLASLVPVVNAFLLVGGVLALLFGKKGGKV